MPISTDHAKPIIPARQSSGGSLKDAGNLLKYSGSKRTDADLWGVLAKALESGQNQIDFIVNALRSPVELPDPIQITNPDGSLVAQLGHMIGADNRSYAGIWGNNVYIGGKGPDTAPFFSNGFATVIGQNGFVEVLDPFGNIGAWIGTQSEAPKAITGAVTAGGQIQLTVTAHGYTNGDWLNVASVGGVPNATGQWLVSVVDANHVNLLGSTFAGTYTSGGTANRFFSGSAFAQVAVAAGKRITGAVHNGAGLVRLTITAHGYSTGYAAVTTNVGGVTGANGSFLVTVINANQVDLVGSVFGSGSYTGGGISINWPTAKFLAQGDGSLRISGATILLDGTGATITLDPTTGTITVVGKGATPTDVVISSQTDPVTGLPAGIIIRNPAQPTRSFLDLGYGFILMSSNNAGLAQPRFFFDMDYLLLAPATGGVTISLETATGNATFVGSVGAGSFFSAAGSIGIGATRTRGVSLSVSTISNGIKGTPGVGQSAQTVVTGVTLNSTTDGFTGGILTS